MQNFLSKKRRVLFVSEASFAKTGFGRLYYELISRINKTNKFDIAEFASFCGVNDPRDELIKWKLYANNVTPQDPRIEKFNSNPNNKTGLWRFDEVLLDFRPDIVLDIRDTPMCSYQAISVLRRFFHWCVCPTVDSAPQNDDFWGSFVEADSLLTYTQYGFDELSKTGINLPLVAPVFFGANPDVFYPISQQHARKELKLPEDKFVVGSVMRNQVRKFLPDLIETISKTDDNTVLYLHTTYPDLMHWNIPQILFQHNAYNKVYFTYLCPHCGKIHAAKWHEDQVVCPHCEKYGAYKLKIGQSASVEQLNTVYNTFDIYVQYANCEGLAVPLLEAASCGLPCAAIDYSAMSNVIERLGGIKLPYLKLQKDINTQADRAIPDNNALLEVINDFASKPKELIKRLGFNTLNKCRENFDWNKCVNIFIDHLESLELTGDQGQWWKDTNFQEIPMPQMNKDEDPRDYINRLIEGWLQEPIFKNSEWIDKLLYYFDSKIFSNGGNIQNMTLEKIVNNIHGLHSNKVAYEKVRLGEVPLSRDFIDYAHIKEMAQS